MLAEVDYKNLPWIGARFAVVVVKVDLHLANDLQPRKIPHCNCKDRQEHR
jgi:hypothetical protein